MASYSLFIGGWRYLFLFLILSAAGCGADIGEGSVSELPAGAGSRAAGMQPTFSSIQKVIFSHRCTGVTCHGAFDPPQQLSLEAGKSYNNLVNVKAKTRDMMRVKPWEPDESFLIYKLEGKDQAFSGNRMPLQRDPLTQEQIDVIKEWIALGAKND